MALPVSTVRSQGSPPNWKAAGWLGAALALVLALVAVDMAIADPRLSGIIANKDFANYWIASRLVLSGEYLDLFGPQPDYFAHMQAAFGADYPWHNWSYPPHYLFFVLPLGPFGYGTALVLFLAATGAAFLLAARAFIGGLRGPVLLFLAAFILLNVLSAQNGFLTGALLLGALALRYDRPVAAGILAGCLTIKPQLGVILPILFLIEGRWTTIAMAALTTGVLVAASAVVFGVEAWQGYIGEVLPYQRGVMYDGVGIFVSMMPSLFGSLRRLGFDGDTALAVHLVFALPVLALACRAMARAGDPHLRACVAIVATFLVTPYSLVYDLGPVATVAAFARISLPGADGTTGLLLVLLSLSPALALMLGLLSVPLAPLLLAAALLLLIQADLGGPRPATSAAS